MLKLELDEIKMHNKKYIEHVLIFYIDKINRVILIRSSVIILQLL
jgi:hypothetical protein